MSNYLSEAFKKLDILDEDVFELDKDGLTALKDFEDSDEDDMITVVDPDAESEEDLEDSYIGKVILDCSVCHTDIYKDKEDITIDEESGLANIGEECPYCYSSDGFKVIGEVKPFVEVEVDTDDDVDIEVDGEEVEEDEDDLDESILRKGRKLIEGSYDRYFSSEDLSFIDYVDNRLIKDVDSLLDVVYDNNGVRVGIVKVFNSAGTRTWIPTVKFLITYSIGKKYGYNIKYETNQFLYRSSYFKGPDGKNISIGEAFNIVSDKLNSKFNIKKIGKDKILILPEEDESLKGHGKIVESISLGDLVSGDSATLMSPFYLGRTGEIADAGSTVEVSDLNGANDVPGGYHYRFYDKNGDLFYEDDLWLYNYDLDDYQDDSIINPDLIKVKPNGSVSESISRRNRRLKESCSINQCQKWVDYDMKKYKKISDDTMKKIKSSGYSVVKDQYGDYEVIADRKDESCGNRKSRKMRESILSEARIKKSWKKIDTVDAEVLDRTRVVAPNAKKYGFYNGEIDFEGTRLPKRGTKLKVDIYDISDDQEWRQYGDEPYYAVINKTKSVKESIEDNEQDIIDIGRAILDDNRKGITSSGNWWELKLKGNYGSYDLDEIADDVTGGSFSGKTDSGIMWKLKIDNKLKESIEDITIDTGDQEIQVSARDKEKESTGEEMIAPLSDEVKADIETGSDDTVDVDVDEFSEEDFDELGESYLKKVYENVDGYKTTSAKTKGNKLYVEGLIKFNSGKQKKTSFVFESRTITKTGKAKLIGENLQISRGHKSFKLTGTINNGKFISESLNYNYRVKNGNSSQRVYGTAKKSK